MYDFWYIYDIYIYIYIYDFHPVLFEIQHLQYVVGLWFTIKEYIVFFFFFLLEGFKLHLFWWSQKHSRCALSPFPVHWLLEVGGVRLGINGQWLGRALCYSVNCGLRRYEFLPKFLASYLCMSVSVHWVCAPVFEPLYEGLSLLMISTQCQESGFFITRMACAKLLNTQHCLVISATKRMFLCAS